MQCWCLRGVFGSVCACWRWISSLALCSEQLAGVLNDSPLIGTRPVHSILSGCGHMNCTIFLQFFAELLCPAMILILARSQRAALAFLIKLSVFFFQAKPRSKT